MNDILSPEKERLILAGAREVFSAHGYEGGSMSRIAQAAGVSKGTLYNYFASKAELFSAYVRHACSERLDMMLEEPVNRSVEAILHDCAVQLHALMFSPAALTIYRVVMAESGKFPELALAYHEAGPLYVRTILSDWLRTQHEAGRMHVPDPVFAAEQFQALTRARFGSLREFQLLHELPDNEVAEVIRVNMQMFMCFYGPEQRHPAKQDRA